MAKNQHSAGRAVGENKPPTLMSVRMVSICPVLALVDGAKAGAATGDCDADWRVGQWGRCLGCRRSGGGH